MPWDAPVTIAVFCEFAISTLYAPFSTRNVDPIELVIIGRSHTRSGGNTIRQWYRRYFHSTQSDERRSRARGQAAIDIGGGHLSSAAGRHQSAMDIGT
jgi:hypothetical protein